MVARAFIDTNVLIYTLSADEPAKQRAALALLGTLRANRQGVLSTQVLQEYANTSRKKLRRSTLDIRADLRAFATFEVVNVTPAIIDAALEVHHAHSLSFYDALVVATAQIAITPQQPILRATKEAFVAQTQHNFPAARPRAAPKNLKYASNKLRSGPERPYHRALQ
jgi:predicted nucleic acid-binding protein